MFHLKAYTSKALIYMHSMVFRDMKPLYLNSTQLLHLWGYRFVKGIFFDTSGNRDPQLNSLGSILCDCFGEAMKFSGVSIILFVLQRHRVVVPEQPKIRSKGRHSIAFFVHPDNDTPITPIQCPMTKAEQPSSNSCSVKNRKSHHAKHNTIYTAYQHLQMRFRETYAS